MCFKGIGLYAQILSIILGSIINLFWGGEDKWPPNDSLLVDFYSPKLFEISSTTLWD